MYLSIMGIIQNTTIITYNIYNQNSNIINYYTDKFRYHGNHNKPDVWIENMKIEFEINSIHMEIVVILVTLMYKQFYSTNNHIITQSQSVLHISWINNKLRIMPVFALK